jgi:hypothetical protein
MQTSLMPEIIVRPVTQADTHEWFRLRCLLWPDLPEARHTEQMDGYYYERDDEAKYCVFVADPQQHEKLAGFVEASMGEHEEPAAGVVKHGRIEGILADPAFSLAEVTQLLFSAAEDWIRTNAGAQIWADCALNGPVRPDLFEHAGFRAARTTISMFKRL